MRKNDMTLLHYLLSTIGTRGEGDPCHRSRLGSPFLMRTAKEWKPRWLASVFPDQYHLDIVKTRVYSLCLHAYLACLACLVRNNLLAVSKQTCSILNRTVTLLNINCIKKKHKKNYFTDHRFCTVGTLRATATSGYGRWPVCANPNVERVQQESLRLYIM